MARLIIVYTLKLQLMAMKYGLQLVVMVETYV